ncbi:MAG: hypothetical protein Q8R76_02505 [Candidatus Omnitrophota bacterium]|nr:hypothetical protein [Candidatus Omnitrophota bacterium]
MSAESTVNEDRPVEIEQVLWIKQGSGIAASGRVPPDAEYFQDHFPRFPVLPGVLMLELFRQMAERYYQAKVVVREVGPVKFSNYLRPGQSWEGQMDVVSQEDGVACWKGRLRHEGRTIVSASLSFEIKHA